MLRPENTMYCAHDQQGGITHENVDPRNYPNKLGFVRLSVSHTNDVLAHHANIFVPDDFLYYEEYKFTNVDTANLTQRNSYKQSTPAQQTFIEALLHEIANEASALNAQIEIEARDKRIFVRPLLTRSIVFNTFGAITLFHQLMKADDISEQLDLQLNRSRYFLATYFRTVRSVLGNTHAEDKNSFDEFLSKIRKKRKTNKLSPEEWRHFALQIQQRYIVEKPKNTLLSLD